MIRLLADADLNDGIVGGCLRREPAIDFLSASEARLHGLSDPGVLQLAVEQKRILVSHDFKTMPRHFARCLQMHGSSPGVFLVKQPLLIGPVIDELVLICTATEPEEWKDRILRIPAP